MISRFLTLVSFLSLGLGTKSPESLITVALN